MDSNHGSVWRKWDFHVHTPYSILNNNFGFDPFELSGATLESKFDEYVTKLFTAAVQQKIAAIGITDYFMIEGYKHIKQNYLDRPEKMRQCFPDEALRHAVEQIYVFPNIELRLNNFVGKDAHSVNYHVCFSPDVSNQEIEDNFLHRLDFKFDNAPYPLTISNEQNVQHLKNIIQHTEEKIQRISVEYNALKNRVAQNQRLQDLTNQITAERTKLQAAKERESARDQAIQKIANLKKKKDILDSQAEFHSAYIAFCAVVKSIGTRKSTSLVFDADVVWRQTDFMQYIVDTFNNKNFSPFKTVNGFDLSDLQPTDYNHTFLTKLIEAWESPDVRGGLALKAGHSNSQALLEIFGDWYNVHYIVRSGNDDIESMSPGKKALVLLEMLSSLEDNKCPILIDQPEDDLDNRSIYNDLVKYIREKKKERQFIIVTHNANVVLGADAEEVIVANQNGAGTENSERRFEYRSGSIENDLIPKDSNGIPLSGILNQTGIQTQICDILEGGRTAFQLRQNKYIDIS